jgi:DNA-binding transcriptional LysR family regulator
MDITLTTLRVIREVAERGSFTAAAVALGYTQSAISRQVAAAEHEVGVQLFDRVTGGVRLTVAGQVLLRQGVIALDALDEASGN